MSLKEISGQTALPGMIRAGGQTYQLPPRHKSYSLSVGGPMQFDPRLLPAQAGGVPGAWSAPRKIISAFSQGHINRSSGSPTGVPASEHVSRVAHRESF